MKANSRNNQKSSENATQGIEEKSHGKVPLYLIPQAVSMAIKQDGGIIQSIHVTRTVGHNYNVVVFTRAGDRTAEDSEVHHP